MYEGIICDNCKKEITRDTIIMDDDMCKIWCKDCAISMNPYMYGDGV